MVHELMSTPPPKKNLKLSSLGKEKHTLGIYKNKIKIKQIFHANVHDPPFPAPPCTAHKAEQH